MNSKILKFFLGALILSLVVFASVFKAKNALAEDANTATPQSEVESYPTTEPQEITVSEQILQQYVETEIFTAFNNGISFSISNFRIEDNKFKVDSCFQTPTQDEWQYFGAHIFFEDGSVVHMNGGTTFSKVLTLQNGQVIFTTFLGDPPQLLSKEIEPNTIADYRCDTLIFNLGEITPTLRFEMKIDAIMLIPNESEGCLQFSEQVREVLKQKEVNIEFECKQGDFSSQFVITKKPDSLSQEEAQSIVSSAYREIRTVQGPWVFSGEIIGEPKLDTTSPEAPTP